MPGVTMSGVTMPGVEPWLALLASPLAWLTATLFAYLAAQELHRRSGGHPLTQPVALAVAMLVALVLATGTPVETYGEATQPLRFLLGPATVALAVPIHQHRGLILRTLLPLGAALLAGCVTAVLSVLALARLFGLSEATTRSLLPKSATMPIAMEVAGQTGGLAALAMVFVMATGILGTILAGPLHRRFPGLDQRGLGFALGLAAHGIGVARAVQIGSVAAVFAGLAMALNGLATALLVPVVLRLAG